MAHVCRDVVELLALRRSGRGDSGRGGAPRPDRHQSGRHAPVGMGHRRPGPAEGRTGGRPAPMPSFAPTSAGLQARAVWPPLFPLVEERWRQRFGERDVDHLREALWAVAGELPAELPDFPPILGHGLWSSGAESRQDRLTAQAALCDEPRSSSPHGSDLSLLTLLFACPDRLRDRLRA